MRINYLHTALGKTDCCTFSYFRAIQMGANKKQVIHNRDKIANILSDAINEGKDDESTTTVGQEGSSSSSKSSSSHLHLEPVVELWCALAKDLQQDFAPYFPRFADAVVHDMTFKVPELIRAAFLALNEVLRTLQLRGAAEKVLDMFAKVMESTLASSARMSPHALALVAEAASNVVRRAKDKGVFFSRLLQYASEDDKAVEVCLEVVLLSCSWNVVSKGKDKNVNVDTWKTWLAACFEKGEEVRDSAVGFLEQMLEGMNRVWAPSDALKCSEILLEKMATASVARSAMYGTAHKILSMSSVKRTPQFVLDYIKTSISELDCEQLPAGELGVPLRRAFEMAKGVARQSLADIIDALLGCEGYSALERTSVVAGLRECDCFDSVCFQRLIDFWGRPEAAEDEVMDVARAVNAICEVRVRSCTWRAYVMKVPSSLVSSVVRRALDCGESGEMVELLRSFVYLRPLERKAFLRVCRHAQKLLLGDEVGSEDFSGGVHALVRSLVKLGDVFSPIEEGTLKGIASKLSEGTRGGLAEELMEAVALLAHADGARAERCMPGLRSSLVRLLSSPDGGVRRNAIAALKGPTIYNVTQAIHIFYSSPLCHCPIHATYQYYPHVLVHLDNPL